MQIEEKKKRRKKNKKFRDNSIIVRGILQVPQLSVSDGIQSGSCCAVVSFPIGKLAQLLHPPAPEAALGRVALQPIE